MSAFAAAAAIAPLLLLSKYGSFRSLMLWPLALMREKSYEFDEKRRDVDLGDTGPFELAMTSDDAFVVVIVAFGVDFVSSLFNNNCCCCC